MGEAEIYKHAKKLEDKLDKLLEIWAPEFVGDPMIDISSMKNVKRPGSPLGGKKDKKRKKKKGSDDETFLSDSDDEVTEVERERQQYLAALHASMKGGDNDPDDGDFDPSEESRGKKRGRRGRR